MAANQNAANQNVANQNSVSQTTNTNVVMQSTAAASSGNTNTVDANKNIILDKIQSLEAVHDYDQAITMLKELASNNLENPEMHHHLAVDL